VPIVGAGFNREAAGGPDWRELIRRVAGEEHAPAIESLDSMTSRWEALLRRHAALRDLPTPAVEAELQRDVVRYLRRFEAHASKRGMYRDFLALGFRDVLSLNFDRSLPLAAGGQRMRGRTSLARRAEVAGTRVWFPHGDTLRAQTLKLGVRQYGRYVAALARAYEAMKEAQHDAGARWRDVVREHPALTWDWLVYNSPVVYVGCSMTADEWPMWWVLHQRAREHARTREPPPAFVLACGGEPTHLRGGPADVIVLPARSFEEGWARFFDAFG
jgi:hypothetical protein